MLAGAASGGSDPWQPLGHLQGMTAAGESRLQPERIADPALFREELARAQDNR